MANAGRDLWRVRAGLLPAALLHPGPRHRPIADRARRGGLAAFIVVLSWPGDRPGGVWLRICPWRGGTDNTVRRRRGAGRWPAVLPTAAPANRRMNRTLHIVSFLIFV